MSRNLSRLFIANRGEVAVRLARAARDLGLAPVGVHAQGEENAPYLAALNSVLTLPQAGPAAFLDPAPLIDAARRLGAEALHPGWGFLSEAPRLAEACAAAGLLFIGPSPAHLALFGDKRRARALAASAGVPVAASAGTQSGAEDLLRRGPILLKAAAGGGGRGMRLVRDLSDLAQSWRAASAEASAAFGEGAIFAETLMEGARHIEVQIAGDGTDAVSLGTRDCSLQRRYQKLVEFAPAAAPPELEAASLRMARQIGYRTLGTWEFLVADGRFIFLEVNPRLQVEHTVTEMVTGLDLPALQIRLAAGETIAGVGLERPPTPRGHAMQFRINTETLREDGQAVPATGTLTLFRPPTGPGIRVDHAAAEGMQVTETFDSLLAKLIVHGEDRAATLRRAARALEEFRIEGVPTLLAAYANLLTLPEIAVDQLHTQFLEQQAARIAVAAAPEHTAANIVAAPMPGTLVRIDVAAGDLVQAGQCIALIEAMKMQMQVNAQAAGQVQTLAASVGDTLREGQLIATLHLSGAAAPAAAPEEVDPNLIRPDLARVIARHAATQDAARAEATARRHMSGKRTIRENIADLVDAGSFYEYGALALAAQRRRRPLEELIHVSPADGVITGFGTIAGRQAAVLAYDYSVMAGTQGFLGHRKTDRLLGLLHDRPLPLVLFAEGGGGRPGDTDVMAVAGLDLSTFASFAALSGRAPLVGIAAGHCFAGNAALLGCCDVIIATESSSIGMGGPAMIEGGGLGRFRPEEVGPASMQAPNGVLDLLVQDEAQAVAQARAVLSYFAGGMTAPPATDPRRLRHLVPEDRRRIYDMHALIGHLADPGSVLELRAAFGGGMITALVRVEGAPFGLIANNPACLAGVIDAAGAEKAARFLQFCDQHGLPILSLCDTPGFMVGPDTERTAQVRAAGRLFVVGAALRVPVFCVVTRRGYGLGAMAMASGGFHRARFTIAWPTGEFGGMGLEGAVRLGHRRELAAEADPQARQALFESLVAGLYEQGEAINMASYLEIDAVIDPADTRGWLMRSLRAAPPARPGSVAERDRLRLT